MSPRQEWLAQLRAKLEQLWRGDRSSAESYLETQSYVADPEAIVELLLTEVRLRRDEGELPELDEYLKRMPEVAGALRARVLGDPSAQRLFAPFSTWDAGQREAEAPASPNDYASLDPDAASEVVRPADEKVPGAADPDEKVDPEMLPTRDYGIGDDDATLARPTLPPGNVSSDVIEARDTDTYATGGTEPLRGAASASWPRVPGYEILGELGRGGMGVVYKAEQTALRRTVALKMILRAEADQTQQVRFRREAEAVARLQHPNIVQIYEVGAHDDRPFFSLEYVEGGNLARQIKDELPEARSTAALMLQLAQAMQAAHERGIIHRDLKPANILIAQNGTPKITDFGLAKNLDEDFSETRRGQIMGTPSYMAPEQALGDVDRVGTTTDVYALGAILYEMLTGRPPFKGTTVYDLLNRVRSEEPVPPRQVQPKASYDLETICLRCLQKDPAKRYASAQALAEDLRRYLDDEPILARRTPILERCAKYVRRKPWVAAFWGLAALGLIASSLWGAATVVRQIHQTQLHVDAQDLLLQVQQEVAEQKQKGHDDGDWDDANALMSQVQGMIRSEPALVGLEDRAAALRHEIDNELEEQSHHRERRRAAQEKNRQFRAGVNTAMLNQLQTIGLRQETNLQIVREVAPRTLALHDVTLASKGQPESDLPYLTPAQRDGIVPGCYELLLSWAHATAHPLEGENPEQQAHKALKILERAAGLGLDTKAYHMRRGTYLLACGDKAAAEIELALAQRMEARTATDNYLVGSELIATVPALRGTARARAYRQAIQHLQRAVDLNAEHYWANFSLGRVFLQSARWDAAVARLSACIQQQPDFLWAYPLRAHAHGMLGEYELALADFELAEKLDDDEVRYGVFVNRGLMFFRQGSALQAKAPEQARQKLQAASAEYQKAIALEPNQYQAYANLAQVYQKLDRRDEAKHQLDQAIKLRRDAALYRTRALLHLRGRDDQAALADLDQAIALAAPGKSADQAADHIERGRILYRRRKFADALAAFNAAQRVHPDEYPLAQRLRAESLLELGQFAEALTAINRFLTRGGKADHDAYLTRGLIRSKLSRHHEAIEDFTLALRAPRSPLEKMEDVDAKHAQTLAYRGWAYLVLNALEIAEHDFNAAIKLDDKNADAHSGRGNARARLGKFTVALADVEASLKLGPPSARLSYNAARTYSRALSSLGRDASRFPGQGYRYQTRALDLLNQALELVPAPERAKFWEDYVQTDPALQPIRSSSRFAQLTIRAKQ